MGKKNQKTTRSVECITSIMCATGAAVKRTQALLLRSSSVSVVFCRRISKRDIVSVPVLQCVAVCYCGVLQRVAAR